VKIAILSDSPFIPTGYSNQAKLLAKHLTDKGHEVHFFANGFSGATVKRAELTDGTRFDYTIYGQGKVQYFQDIMSGLLKQLKIDVFIILLDTFMLHGAPGNPLGGWFLQIDTSPAQTIFWFPSDGGGGMPTGCELVLKKVEKAVAMAEFGQKQVKDYYQIETDHIPHGTEPKRFYKLPDEQRNEIRKKWNLHDKFVVGVVARNQPRKFLDRTLKTIYLLKDKIPNLILFLHLDPNDPAQPNPIREMIARYNLENRVVFSGMSALKGFDWNEMNHIYNLFDCFFLSTSGEGFGIPIIEAMSCEVPVVATSYTTTPELVERNNAGYGVKLSGVEKMDLMTKQSEIYDIKSLNGTIIGSWMVDRGLIDCEEAANKIESIYLNKDLSKQMGKNGRKAVLERYDFENVIGPAWEKRIKEVLA